MNNEAEMLGSNIPSNLRDANRSALAVIRFIRAGNTDGLLDLVGTLDDSEKGQLCGALGAIANERSPSATR